MSERTYDTIEWSFDEESGIGSIVLDRPDNLNALSTGLREDIVAGFEALEALDAAADGVVVRAVIIEGAGDRAFSAGADINEFEDVNPGVFDPSPLYDIPEEYQAPVIAKIDGYALGGGLELALACDFRIASERSTVGQPEIDLGLIPGGGGTQRLPDVVGPSRAKELCITGEHVAAADAVEEGIVDRVYPTADLDEEVAVFAETIAEKPPLAVRAVKDVVNTRLNTSLNEGLKYERRAFFMLRSSEDHQEGVSAFAEDRAPSFEGK